MRMTEIFEGIDMCRICGQTPCNCTGIINGGTDGILEAATAGATSSGNIATVVNPGMTNKNPAAGSPGKMAKKGPPQYMPKKQKPTDNALNSNVGLMTGQTIKR